MHGDIMLAEQKALGQEAHLKNMQDSEWPRKRQEVFPTSW